MRHFVSVRRSGDLKDMFVFYLESSTINGISTTISKELKIADRFGGGGCKDLSCEKKNVWERGGSTSTSKTEVTVRSCCKKQFEKKTLPKALKFSDCRESIRRQIQPSYKKS